MMAKTTPSRKRIDGEGGDAERVVLFIGLFGRSQVRGLQ